LLTVGFSVVISKIWTKVLHFYDIGYYFWINPLTFDIYRNFTVKFNILITFQVHYNFGLKLQNGYRASVQLALGEHNENFTKMGTWDVFDCDPETEETKYHRGEYIAFISPNRSLSLYGCLGFLTQKLHDSCKNLACY